MEKKINVQNTYFMVSSIFGVCDKINERGPCLLDGLLYY